MFDKFSAKLAVLILATSASFGALAQQDAWPSRAIRLIVPASAGGPTDVVARLVADKLSASLGQSVFVDNRAGAGHIIGTQAAARAAPDGYTFLFVTTPHVVNPWLKKDMPYDTVKDFQPVSWLTSLPLVLVVNPSVQATTVEELVALAKAKPGVLNMATPGNGTGPHLAGELFKSTAGIDVVHVPYKGGPQAVAAMLAGEGDFEMDSPSNIGQLVKAGKLRALGVTTATRSSLMPDVPTIAEAGYPDYEVNIWNGMVAPAGTPMPIVLRMRDAAVAAMAQPDVKARLEENGFEIVGSTPAQFGELIDRDLAKWQKAVKNAGMTAN